ncbi:hypothetical protein JP74_23390, partial [Devosia sp. 17-2-E-8]
ERTTTWSDDMVEDPVQDRLLDIIKQKQRKTKKDRPKADAEREEDVEAPNNVIDLMAALKKSLEGKPEAPAKKTRR